MPNMKNECPAPFFSAEHRQAIRDHGPCPIHRRTFKGVREYI